MFHGIGADRLVLGKPGCQGCAGSDYLDLAGMSSLIGQFDHKLTKTMGGILFWDLGRLFGNTGPMCVSGSCQPSWGGDSVLANLQSLKMQMDALHTQQRLTLCSARNRRLRKSRLIPRLHEDR